MPPAYFDGLYARAADPWGFSTSAYERDKYAATLRALPARRFRDAVEVGCSIGVLTRRLAARCHRLLGVDVAETALARARESCADLSHVAFRRMQVPREWPDGRFDLVLFSEVLYFLSPQDIRGVAAAALATRAADGVFLLVNWTGRGDNPCSGDEAAQLFTEACAGTLRVSAALRAPQYRLDLLTPPG
ncbi:MAG: methyltransferase domain-containing protein [Acidisphaera sp.]|nr:methyltransferase domain-containing protein [Acidisphaera sp.]